MNLEELEARVTRLEDIEAIKKLQRMYGFYIDCGMWKDVIDLFSDETESVEIGDHGVMLGKAGVRRLFGDVMGQPRPDRSWWLARVMINQGVVHLNPDGKTAKGRWQAVLCEARTVGALPRQSWGHGIYENEYVKENGKWLFKKLHFNFTFYTPYEDGWLKTPTHGTLWREGVADALPTAYHPYPSGYEVPYHWEQSVTRE